MSNSGGRLRRTAGLGVAAGVTGSADTTAQVWDLRTGQSIGPSLARRRPVRDGKRG
ncbi:MAG: hypothetical protein ACLQIB_27600 [Isosphaeraceae bacterium]